MSGISMSSKARAIIGCGRYKQLSRWQLERVLDKYSIEEIDRWRVRLLWAGCCEYGDYIAADRGSGKIPEAYLLFKDGSIDAGGADWLGMTSKTLRVLADMLDAKCNGGPFFGNEVGGEVDVYESGTKGFDFSRVSGFLQEIGHFLCSRMGKGGELPPIVITTGPFGCTAEAYFLSDEDLRAAKCFLEDCHAEVVEKSVPFGWGWNISFSDEACRVFKGYMYPGFRGGDRVKAWFQHSQWQLEMAEQGL